MTEYRIEIPSGTPFPEVSREANGTLLYDLEYVKQIIMDSDVPAGYFDDEDEEEEESICQECNGEGEDRFGRRCRGCRGSGLTR